MKDGPMTPEEIAGLPYRRCAGVMLVNRQGRVFVGQRIDTPGDAWQMPQGGIDAGEAPRAAALRELHEETGVTPDLVRVEAETVDWISYDLPADLLGRVWGGKYRGQKQRWFLMRYLGTDERIDITQPPTEFSEWCWLPKDELVERIVPFKRAVYARIMDEFGALI